MPKPHHAQQKIEQPLDFLRNRRSQAQELNKRAFPEAAPGFEPGMEDLQSSALPLGHAAARRGTGYTNMSHGQGFGDAGVTGSTLPAATPRRHVGRAAG